jgi:DNA-binding NtrC family response regulator
MHSVIDSNVLTKNRTRVRVRADEDVPTGDATDLQNASRTGAFGQMTGRSQPMLDVYHRIERVAPTGATVLLVGETGTGKEIAARTIHDRSRRREHPFLAVNCGAISGNLIESELFGHENGSFTGARKHDGLFTQADKGTLFLDEITEMAMDLQVRLLRVLESGTFRRIGGESEIRTDVRIIAAANRPIEAAVREGRLREDLFHRLNVFPIHMPPLRARGHDIELLARQFLDNLNAKEDAQKRFAPAALVRMLTHSWPGNVRDLKHFVARAFILADHDLSAESLLPAAPPRVVPNQFSVRVGSSIAMVEMQLIKATMTHLRGDKQAVAAMLGTSLKTLYARLGLYKAVETGCP